VQDDDVPYEPAAVPMHEVQPVQLAPEHEIAVVTTV